jgi:putative peptide zinc metalloprotease protein
VSVVPRAARRSSPLLSATKPEESLAELSARRGAPGDRPALRLDLVVRRQVQMGDVQIVVKNPETLKLYFVDEDVWGLIQMFDGERTRLEIVDEYNRLHPDADLTLKLVLEYEELTQGMGILVQSTAERNLRLLSEVKKSRRRAAEEKAEGFNPFFMLFKVFDPDPFLNRTVRYVRWIWTPPAVALCSVGFAFTIAIFAQNWDALWRETIELYSFLKKPFWDFVQFWVIQVFIGFIHESGHAYATKIYGGDDHEMGIALFYFMPAFYTDTTDQLLFDKWQRLWVNIAGIYVESGLCMLATFVWVASYPDTLVHELAYKTMLFTGVSTIFFNINPLIKIDGYHALTSVLEIPELREESFAYLGALFQRHVLRLPVEVPVLSRRKRRIFWIYGPLALAYVGVVMAFIGGLFGNFYSKYFPNVAALLVTLTLYRLFRKRVRLCFRVAKLFYLDKKEYLMSPRARFPLAASTAALLLVLAVPWARQTIQEDVTLRPAITVRVEAPEDGTISEVLAREGDALTEGTPIATLESTAVTARLASLAVEDGRLAKEASRSRGAAEAGGAFRAEQQSLAVVADLQNQRGRRDRLAVHAPLAGRVLTPRIQDLQGRFVRAGDLIAEVGDCRRLIAEIRVTERLLGDLAPGDGVSLRVRGRPLGVLHGSVATISPASLALPKTSREAKGVLRPPELPERFVALAAFENRDGTLLPGMSGTAKIYLKRESFLHRGWRVLRDWAQTVFWW